MARGAEKGNKGTSGNRMYFMDNLRSFIILLVIAFHVAIGYMAPAPEWWYVVDSKSNPIFNIFVMTTDVFIMPILFLLAGYFTMPVLKKQGMSRFLREKFFRIVIPWIAGVLFLAPAITYMIWYSRTSTPPAYFNYWMTNFFSAATFSHAHYWFLGDLTWFLIFFSVLYKRFPTVFQRNEKVSSPSFGFLVLFGLGTAATFFIANLYFYADAWFSRLYIISLQPTRFFLYVCYFALGIYAWLKRWFTELGYMPRFEYWMSSSVIAMLAFVCYRITFTDTTPILLRAGHAILHSFFCLTTAFGFISFFHKDFNRKGDLWRRLSANSYRIYYIHQFVVLPIAYMVQKLEFSVWVKYFSVSIISVLSCFIISEYVIGKVLYRKHEKTL
ncbi:acyltransferase family protein [Pelosinus propionicus]|uniref:Fucose 4-O-acetylase n=1 Tax=Pelosinus propionicus DSM 13327 TaxID=1123291 RepID=A0A1I4P5G1_9FIRM|nr:acyltransferase family protein [Pelosinus propionicus]SFM22777.1 Fucose 4-O-acetylase [Pelosinus propionicus DSM 13327]